MKGFIKVLPRYYKETIDFNLDQPFNGEYIDLKNHISININFIKTFENNIISLQNGEHINTSLNHEDIEKLIIESL